MKRARRGNFSRSTVSKRQLNEKTLDENVKNNIDENKYNVNEEEKRDLQMKYYGKVMDEEENRETAEVLSAQAETEKGQDISTELHENNSESSMQSVDETENIQEAVSDENEMSEETASNPEENIISGEEESVSENTEKISKRGKLKKLEGKKKTILIFSVSLVVFICFSLIAFGLSGFFDKSPLNGDSNEDYMAPVDEVTGKVNVLLLGVDNEGLRTDTIMVVSYDTDDHIMNILSIPRDTRMYVGTRYQKINAAHAITKNGKIAGPQGSIEAVTRLTGIPINYYVEFSFEAFRETIDALGGVYFNVPQNMNYEDQSQDLYIHLTSGYQLLDGDKAEQLVRFRQYPQGDIKRVEVQQSFIKAVAEQKMNASIITKLPNLYKTLSENIETNFSLSDMTKYGPSLLQLSMDNITTYSLPGDYSGGEYSASYWIADMNELKELIETTFGYDASKITYKKPGEYLTFTDSDSDNTKKETASSTASSSSSDKKTSKPTSTAQDKAESTKKPTSTSSSKQTEKPESTTEPEEPEKTIQPEKTEKTTTPVHSSAPSFGTEPGTIIDASGGDSLKDVEDPSSYGDIAKTPSPTSTSTPTRAPVTTPSAENNQNSGTSGSGRPQANQ